MPVTPHPITISVKDVDNSTAKQGARVYVRNTTKKSTSSVEIANSSGQAVIDLANLPLTGGQSAEYEAGDKILIIAYHGLNHDAAMYTVTGSSKSQTLYLNPFQLINDVATQKINTLVTANTAASVAYMKAYAINDGQLLLHVETPANDSKILPLGKLGGAGGIVIEREANTLVVTASLK